MLPEQASDRKVRWVWHCYGDVYFQVESGIISIIPWEYNRPMNRADALRWLRERGFTRANDFKCSLGRSPFATQVQEGLAGRNGAS